MPLKEKPFFGRQLPEVREPKFAGRLFAIEGADGSGRSTQIGLLSQWLEANGYAVRHMGLRRSNLVAEELEDAKQGNVPKAIEAYRRLALKYPEKSAYFAALQKELEAQLNK